MIKNKKAWLRVVEAFIAIILITSVLIVLYAKGIDKPKKTEAIYNMQRTILEEIAFDPKLRDAVLKSDNETIINLVRERIPKGVSFLVRICDIEDICSMDEYKQEVYSTERIISSTLQEYSPKKIRIFMWED